MGKVLKPSFQTCNRENWYVVFAFCCLILTYSGKIIVRSSKESTQNLISFLGSVTGFTGDIFSPSLTEEIKIGEHVQSYSLTLGDSISSALAKKWSDVSLHQSKTVAKS